MIGLEGLKRKFGNRYFLSITLISFLLLILLTSLALLASFSIYRDEVMKKAIVLRQERLNSYSRQINIQFDKILSTTEQLVSDKLILDWIHQADSDQDMYQTKRVIDRLQYTSIFNEAVLSLELYNDKNGSIVSHSEGFHSGEEDDAFMRARKEIYTDMMQSQDIKQLIISSESFQDPDTPTFMLLSSVPVYKKNGALGMVIQADKLIPVNVSPSEHIFIVNSKNPSLLFNNSGDRLPISKVETDNWVQQVFESDMGSNLGVINIGGERYYSAYRNIFSNQFKLLILVSETDIAADLENFSVFIKSAFAIIFVLSVLCSFLIYRIANKPIRKIAEQISRKLNDRSADKAVGYRADGIQYLNRTFDMILNRSSRLEKILENRQDVIHENALRSLIYGKRDDETLRFYGERYGTDHPSNFMILIFNLDSHHPQSESYLFEHADKLIFNGFMDPYGGSYLRTGHRQFTMLVNLKKPDDREPLLHQIRTLQEKLQQQHGSTLTVGVSSVKHEMEEISLCYNEAQEAIRHRALLGANRIIDSTLLSNGKKKDNSFSIQEGQLLIKKLRTASEDDITDTIIRMIDEKKHRYSIEMLNAFLLYISSCIGQVGMEYNLNPDDIFDNNLFKIIAEHHSIEEMKTALINQCKKIIEMRQQKQKEFKKLSGELAIKFIEENYDRPISLDIVASELNMSPSYLSRLIKQELGKNFNVYLNQLRIEKAIEWLREGNRTVKEISISAGYENEHTFIRNFKSHTGKTPAEYRNTVLRKSKGMQNA